MLKHTNKKQYNIIEGENYVADRVRVIIYKKGEIIVISTSLTVLRAENEDTFSINSLELSQKENDVNLDRNIELYEEMKEFNPELSEDPL